ncbi:hypothetical protein [Aliamphritea hakodatensis]|uniref:hypothetical protein n=1 Tax=Aliamphritea hakodatensis TaxID=2895352 RepID=UPI0022FD902E|nr:hypothetical protein [Aliamphritea hakodatensis]
MSQSPLFNIDNRAGVRLEQLAFAQYFPGKASCLYGADHQGKGKLYIKEANPEEGQRLLKMVTDAALKCPDKQIRICLPEGGFIATDYVGGISPSHDGKAAVISDAEGKPVFWLSDEDYTDINDVIVELLKAVNSTNPRKPYQINWDALRIKTADEVAVAHPSTTANSDEAVANDVKKDSKAA